MKTKTLIATLWICMLQFASAQTSAPLSDWLRWGIEKNPKLSAAREEVQAARARGAMLRSEFNPKISLNGYISSGDMPMLFQSEAMPFNYSWQQGDSMSTANVTLMFPVLNFGRDTAARKASQADTAAAGERLRTTELDVEVAVALRFAESAAQLEIVRAYEASVANAEEVARISEEMFKVGKVPEAFVFRANADLAAARRELAMERAKLEAVTARLLSSAARDLGEEALPGDWDLEMAAPPSLAEAVERATALRPELAEMRTARLALLNRADLAGRGLLPKVSFMAMGDANWMDGGEEESGSRIGLVMSIPVADGGERRSIAKELRSMANRMEADYQSMVLEVRAEVSEAWAMWNASDAVLAAARAEVSASEEAYRVALLRYTEGKSILAELTDARAQVASARRSAAEAVAYKRVAWAQLRRAIGMRLTPQS